MTSPLAHLLQGIVNRLAVDEAEVEERVFVEAITNQYESREAVKYAGTFLRYMRYIPGGTLAQNAPGSGWAGLRSQRGRMGGLAARVAGAEPAPAPLLPAPPPPPPHTASRPPPRPAGTLVAVPLLVGFLVSRAVAQPVWSYAEGLDPRAFAPSDIQKVEGAHELHVEELRLRMVRRVGPRGVWRGVEG